MKRGEEETRPAGNGKRRSTRSNSVLARRKRHPQFGTACYYARRILLRLIERRAFQTVTPVVWVAETRTALTLFEKYDPLCACAGRSVPAPATHLHLLYPWSLLESVENVNNVVDDLTEQGEILRARVRYERWRSVKKA